MVALFSGLILSRALLATQDLSLSNSTAKNVRARLLESARARQQQASPSDWIQEITTASWLHQGAFLLSLIHRVYRKVNDIFARTRDGGLLNVVDEPKSFPDSSSTALLAAVTYRMTVFTHDTSLLSAADKAFAFIKDNIDDLGWLQGIIDPHTFYTPSPPGSHSPEGQAFVLLLQAAYSAWKSSLTK